MSNNFHDDYKPFILAISIYVSGRFKASLSYESGYKILV